MGPLVAFPFEVRFMDGELSDSLEFRIPLVFVCSRSPLDLGAFVH